MAKGAAVRGGRAGAARTRVRGSRRTNAAGLRHSHPSHSHPSPLARCARAAVCRGQQLQKSLSRRRSYEDATGSGLSKHSRRGARGGRASKARSPAGTLRRPAAQVRRGGPRHGVAARLVPTLLLIRATVCWSSSWSREAAQGQNPLCSVIRAGVGELGSSKISTGPEFSVQIRFW